MSEGHPYREPWKPARSAIKPGRLGTPEELRKELLRLRAQVDEGDRPGREELAQTIAQLTDARDAIRGAARPARGALVAMAAILAGPVALTVARQPHGLAAAAVVCVIGLAAAALAEWINRWLDLVPEYDGLIADLRKSAQPPAETNAAGIVLSIAAVESEGVDDPAGRIEADLVRLRALRDAAQRSRFGTMALFDALHRAIRKLEVDIEKARTGVRVDPSGGEDDTADEDRPARGDATKKREL